MTTPTIGFRKRVKICYWLSTLRAAISHNDVLHILDTSHPFFSGAGTAKAICQAAPMSHLRRVYSVKELYIGVRTCTGCTYRLRLEVDASPVVVES